MYVPTTNYVEVIRLSPRHKSFRGSTSDNRERALALASHLATSYAERGVYPNAEVVIVEFPGFWEAKSAGNMEYTPKEYSALPATARFTASGDRAYSI